MRIAGTDSPARARVNDKQHVGGGNRRVACGEEERCLRVSRQPGKLTLLLQFLDVLSQFLNLLFSGISMLRYLLRHLNLRRGFDCDVAVNRLQLK